MRLREYLFYLGDAVVVGNNPASPGLVTPCQETRRG